MCCLINHKIIFIGKKHLSHCSHLKDFSPLWVLWYVMGKASITLITFKRLLIVVCSLMCHKRTFRSKHSSHCLHLKGFLPLCVLWWIIRWAFLIKHLSHWSHLKGLFPLCVTWCLTGVIIWAKHLSHWSHLSGFSPLCVIWWLKIPLLWVKYLSKWSYLNGFCSPCILWW